MSPEPVGTLAEEALRFAEALRVSLGPPAADGATDGSADQAHTGPECRVCPLCRGLAALRQVRPEAIEHLAAAMSELAQALREVLAPGAGPPARQDGSVVSPRGATATGSVQHIDITD